MPKSRENGIISAAEYKTRLFDTRLSSRVAGDKNKGSRQNEKYK